MTDTPFPSGSLDWSSLLTTLDSEGSTWSDAIPLDTMDGTSEIPHNTVVSEFEQLERTLGSQTIANHVDLTADSIIASPSRLSGLPSDPTSTLSDLKAQPVPPSLISPPTESGSSQSDANNASLPTPPLFEKGIEVQQLRRRYHEKYKERNRSAATKSRQKQVDPIELIEAEREEEERRRKALTAEVQQLQKELLAIRQELQQHMRLASCMTMMSHGAHLQTLGLLAHDVLR
ncbi:hypothetical protein BO71DRAFT_411132 [Aspergillus ellipticus CBS 707.79]|uniref:BZIP domain-containing protein n=1 Tax=Aspergillus ellipticus CBS 707.79 TaxID=1448320 RepID=A0A319D481_9EURO|nr:hypothetical protein BO71DRAFT_411132 [Aspergillus ellipticus CBS 707.79]